jgi:adenine C2-methylase RlmN of 23S rRNA A2503 and tRNA A37
MNNVINGRVPFVVWHSWTSPTGRRTGVLEITTSEKRIWSVPSLWGCPVGCTFCVSSNQAYAGPIGDRDLQDLLTHVRASSLGHQPVEISFTGEGEAVLNVENVLSLIEHVRHWSEIDSARVCVSGLKVERVLELSNFPWPTRLQCSLHSAIEETRRSLIPKSIALDSLRLHLLALTPKFVSIDLNVVLQPGVNDCSAHLHALIIFARGTPWRVVFNPHMQEEANCSHPATRAWRTALQDEGIPAAMYHTIGTKIVDQGIYKKLSFVRPDH